MDSTETNRECVRVMVRCRPLNSKEVEAKHATYVKNNHRMSTVHGLIVFSVFCRVVVVDKELGQIVVEKANDAQGIRSWTYDGVFPSE